MKNKTIAVDLAKNVFQIGVSDRPGHVEKTYRLSRAKFLKFFVNREPATVVMEACGSAHYWGRQIRELGHTVVLISPQYVTPYVRRNKTDRTDVKGLLEAYRDSDIHPVPIKTLAQQQLTALHRIRSTWMRTRTARINTVRGLLREFGYVIPTGADHLVPGGMELIEDADVVIPSVVREMFHQVCGEIRALESRMRSVEQELKTLARQMPEVARLTSIPGIGLLTATAMVGFVGNIKRFRTSRHFTSYLELTPREHSSGNRRRMGRISKQGDRYLRMLLVHGGRSLLWSAHREGATPTPLQQWGLQKHEFRGHNKAIVALANKLARRVWAVWNRDCDHQGRYQAA